MIEIPRFEAHFKQYGFEWMARAPGKYSEVIVRELNTTYNNELKRKYPQGKLWKYGDHISLVTIWGVWVDISACAISRFLYGSIISL